jgi:hypothetical protein
MAIRPKRDGIVPVESVNPEDREDSDRYFADIYHHLLTSSWPFQHLCRFNGQGLVEFADQRRHVWRLTELCSASRKAMPSARNDLLVVERIRCSACSASEFERQTMAPRRAQDRYRVVRRHQGLDGVDGNPTSLWLAHYAQLQARCLSGGASLEPRSILRA